MADNDVRTVYLMTALPDSHMIARSVVSTPIMFYLRAFSPATAFLGASACYDVWCWYENLTTVLPSSAQVGGLLSHTQAGPGVIKSGTGYSDSAKLSCLAVALAVVVQFGAKLLIIYTRFFFLLTHNYALVCDLREMIIERVHGSIPIQASK
jgi:hypothetical protein